MNRRNFLSLAALACLTLAGWGLPQPNTATIFMPVGWQGQVCIVAEPQIDASPQKHCRKQVVHKDASGVTRYDAVMPKDASGYSVYTTSRYGHKFSMTAKDGHVVSSGVDAR